MTYVLYDYGDPAQFTLAGPQTLTQGAEAPTVLQWSVDSTTTSDIPCPPGAYAWRLVIDFTWIGDQDEFRFITVTTPNLQEPQTMAPGYFGNTCEVAGFFARSSGDLPAVTFAARNGWEQDTDLIMQSARLFVTRLA